MFHLPGLILACSACSDQERLVGVVLARLSGASFAESGIADVSRDRLSQIR